MADLDEISEAIGGLRVEVRLINAKVCDNRQVADKRHSENKTRLEKIEDCVSSLAADRRVAIIGISAITGAVMWLASYFIIPVLKKLGWT